MRFENISAAYLLTYLLIHCLNNRLHSTYITHFTLDTWAVVCNSLHSRYIRDAIYNCGPSYAQNSVWICLFALCFRWISSEQSVTPPSRSTKSRQAQQIGYPNRCFFTSLLFVRAGHHCGRPHPRASRSQVLGCEFIYLYARVSHSK